MPNEFAPLISALSNFGAFGVLVAFLIWKDLRAERQQQKMEQDHMAEKRLWEERRIAVDKETNETNKALAGSLAGLTAVIQDRNHK